MIHVYGPHGSGNRLNHRMIQASPLFTEPDDAWVWSLPARPKEIVLNTPKPDYCIVSVRDPVMTANSMLKEGMVRNMTQARGWVLEARQQVDDIVAAWDVPTLFVIYEDTLAFGAEFTIGRMAKFFDIPWWPFDEEIVDGNKKYYAAE